ncbi:glycosyltransferase family protein [Microterricola viridarii]|uniref:Glycosyltransferase involved in cell wall bisynthesis n=1 Tax=Microterricola viridarii TaxID=412690 RepID=A0A1H1ZJJ3_9MICO|nr:hypothetical protein [Microterricola viridarii]SDT33789.1 Glycosyltransferase involved in cell wall bisynthesis [Microterricola viridarii]
MVVRVLMSPGPRISNPFISVLIENLDGDIEVREFTWRRAFLSSYDLLHVHWPDALLLAPTPSRRALKILELRMLIAWNKVRRIRHVWTVHNLDPHERGGRARAAALRVWARSCDLRVFLSEAAQVDTDSASSVVIKHGDYAKVAAENASNPSEVVPGRMLAFGLLRPYKGIGSLISATQGAAVGIEPFALRVVGRPQPESYGEELRAQASGHPNIEFSYGRLSDAELVCEIQQSEFVVLSYKRIYNSGAAILALTLGRPIICATSATMLELQQEVGPEWVYCLEGELTTSSLMGAVSELRARTRSQYPIFQDRDWRLIGGAYSEQYKSLKSKS